MKTSIATIIAVIAASAGCSSTSIVQAAHTDGGAGAAGEIGSSGAAGSAGAASAAGQGGSADGGAGSPSTGGTGSGGSSGSGTGGSGGGSCTPKTCATMSYALTDGGATTGACGVFPDDGCGNVLDCGSCDPIQTCGGANTPAHICTDLPCSGTAASWCPSGSVHIKCPNDSPNANPANSKPEYGTCAWVAPNGWCCHT